ncbi:hypothetical protein MNBD_GAMMA23-738 [hydrothermal vent metagenome]|uniref:Uncharacterized protein n=1 Tax=hydrothermal vent metagenome TaxID=652676 RepID=A0A3B0ZQ44_9ZZZZ
MTIEDTQNSSIDNQDAAWASINTPLHIDAMLVFIQDVERLLRINPMLEFKKWEKLGASQYFMAGRNISQETAFEFETKLTAFRRPNGLEIEYETGVKASTVIEVEAIELENGKLGSKLTITDHYDRLDEETRQNKLDEVDKSLVIWATDLQRYLVTWRRWSRIRLWRLYMKHVWLPMKPSGRRITYMLLWISVVEVALIALGVGIYFSEYR